MKRRSLKCIKKDYSHNGYDLKFGDEHNKVLQKLR